MSEISVENLANLEKRYRVTVFIILAQIFFALILGGATPILLAGKANAGAGGDLSTLWVALLFIAIGSFILRRLFFNWERLRNIALLKGIPGVLGSLQVNSVILAALAELVAVIGFIVVQFSGDAFDMFRALAVALVVFLINFPRKGVWKKIVANLETV